MELAYVFLAKFADTATDGTLSLVGVGFDTVTTPTLPVLVPAITVIARVLVSPDECEREHNLRGELFCPDEVNPRATADLRFTPRLDPSRPNRPVGVNCIMGWLGLAFAEQGEFEFRLSIGGRPLGRTTLSVIHRPA